MKSNLKISLVIPAYNEERYIGDCLSHVIKNSNNSFYEIIVIDNASTDKTSEIAKSFPQVNVVCEKKKGLTQARQAGFIHATGDILAYIDADTRMPPGWYEKIYSVFSTRDDVACLSGPYNYYDVPQWRNLSVRAWYMLAVPFYWITRYMVTGGNFAIRKDVLEKMGGFDTTISFYGEDTNIARRAHQHGKVLFRQYFSMPTSARRFDNQGLFKTAFVYGLNFIWEVVFKKPFSKTYSDFR
jgi:glycosyltransferase involved in cell wall biosynthesis